MVAFRCGGWELLTSDDSKLLPYEIQSRLARIHDVVRDAVERMSAPLEALDRRLRELRRQANIGAPA
jgi:hypothetical protein